jgi:hypothetical protein
LEKQGWGAKKNKKIHHLVQGQKRRIMNTYKIQKTSYSL